MNFLKRIRPWVVYSAIGERKEWHCFTRGGAGKLHAQLVRAANLPPNSNFYGIRYDG